MKLNLFFRCFIVPSIYFLLFGLLSLSCNKEQLPPTCYIETTGNTDSILQGEIIDIRVFADDPDGAISHTSLLIDNIEVRTAVSLPLKYSWNTLNEKPGTRCLTAITMDNDKNFANRVIHRLIIENPALHSAPAPAFNAHHRSLLVNTPVRFFDLSKPNPTSCTWEFGDGNTGTGKTPVHIYKNAGSYTVRLTVSNNEGTASHTKSNYITILSNADTVVADYNGHVYNTVTIGEQIWLKENIKSTHFSNGDPIADGTHAGNLDYDTISQFYFSYDNQDSNICAYGRLYTWSAVMGGALSSNSNPSGVQGICPSGWHVPSDVEWMELELFLGMTPDEVVENKIRGDKEGGMLKETGTAHWMNPNEDATDLYGFDAVPGGERFWSGVFRDKTKRGCYHSSTKFQHNAAWQRWFYHSHGKISRSDFSRVSVGASVRCVKDDRNNKTSGLN